MTYSRRAASEFQAGTNFGQGFGAKALDVEKIIERCEGTFFDNALGQLPGKALHSGQFLDTCSIDGDAL